jgi:DNA-binding transcriptional MerR regulator
MHAGGQKEILLTALECATRMGVSIRALRLYEQQGLISPRRTSKQWRLYGHDEIARLNEIIALKSLGLSLRDIAGLLRGNPIDLAQTLGLQHNILTDTKNRAERGLQVIEALQSKIHSSTLVSVDDLMILARETNMSDSSKDTVAWRRYEEMRPRIQAKIDTALYDDYAGAYEPADGTISIVSRRDDRLFCRVVGQSDIEIFPESDTAFFMKVLPVQIVFERDADGQVRTLYHHQHGFHDKTHRMDLDLALRIEDEVQKRIKDQIPMQDSESILRRIIEEHVRGEPDLDTMSLALAALAEEQKDFIRTDLEEAGELKALSFKGVSQVGMDIYDAEFEHAKMEWGFAVTHRGKISHLYLRRTP